MYACLFVQLPYARRIPLTNGSRALFNVADWWTLPRPRPRKWPSCAPRLRGWEWKLFQLWYKWNIRWRKPCKFVARCHAKRIILGRVNWFCKVLFNGTLKCCSRISFNLSRWLVVAIFIVLRGLWGAASSCLHFFYAFLSMKSPKYRDAWWVVCQRNADVLSFRKVCEALLMQICT